MSSPPLDPSVPGGSGDVVDDHAAWAMLNDNAVAQNQRPEDIFPCATALNTNPWTPEQMEQYKEVFAGGSLSSDG